MLKELKKDVEEVKKINKKQQEKSELLHTGILNKIVGRFLIRNWMPESSGPRFSKY